MQHVLVCCQRSARSFHGDTRILYCSRGLLWSRFAAHESNESPRSTSFNSESGLGHRGLEPCLRQPQLAIAALREFPAGSQAAVYEIVHEHRVWSVELQKAGHHPLVVAIDRYESSEPFQFRGEIPISEDEDSPGGKRYPAAVVVPENQYSRKLVNAILRHARRTARDLNALDRGSPDRRRPRPDRCSRGQYTACPESEGSFVESINSS
jgi:hypothetical protein